MKKREKLNIILNYWDDKKSQQKTKTFEDYGTLALFIEQKHLEQYRLNGVDVFRF